MPKKKPPAQRRAEYLAERRKRLAQTNRRMCQLPGCGNRFFTNVERRFCCIDHGKRLARILKYKDKLERTY